jgi:hypothetical protein
MRRLTGVLFRPRATFAALIGSPVWITTWIFTLIVWAGCGAGLLSTEVGQQALVDERVRVIETLGGTVSDEQYAELQARPPWWVYVTSGGRILLLPFTTLLAAVILLAVARSANPRATLQQALAIVVHANIVLLVGQVAATPLHFVRESLTSPLNLAAVLPFMDDGTLPARFFGTIDLFAAWWAGLLALGLATLTNRRARHYAWPIAAAFLLFAAISATVTVVMGGA